jgi:hypothetical protein
VLLRLLYLALTSVFALIRLRPMTDSDKNVEILTLRHQLAILQRQIDKPASPRLTGRSSPRSNPGRNDRVGRPPSAASTA